MSHTPRSPAELHAPAPGPVATLAITAVLLAATLGALVAVSHPGAALAAAAVVLTAASAVHAVRRHRRQATTTRRVCVPRTDVCASV